jgi:alpha-L-fucosidase
MSTPIPVNHHDIPPGINPASRHDPDLAWFREARFGMFVHWGLYSIPAGVWKDEVLEGNYYAEWIQKKVNKPLGIPQEEYRALARQFNPARFDAEEWIAEARNAGMRYFLITAKHHDGFALWPSKVSKYNIADATPFGRDVLDELRKACDRQGLRLGFYYSHWQDWEHPGGARPAGNDEGHHGGQPDSGEFEEYWTGKCLPQVRELIEWYRPGFFWFDCWRKDEVLTPERLERLIGLVHGLDPACLVNSRIGVTWNHPKGDELADYLSTHDNCFPDQRVERAWETSGTLQRSWGYHQRDYRWEETGALLRHLVDNASRGGNYQLNVGPMADGRLPAPAVRRLREVGAWMLVNGESVVGTQPADMPEPSWGRLTQRKLPGGGRRIYAHVYNWSAGRPACVQGWTGGAVRECRTLETGQPVEFEVRDGRLFLIRPAEAADSGILVVAVDVTT